MLKAGPSCHFNWHDRFDRIDILVLMSVKTTYLDVDVAIERVRACVRMAFILSFSFISRRRFGAHACYSGLTLATRGSRPELYDFGPSGLDRVRDGNRVMAHDLRSPRVTAHGVCLLL
jgi:hypothetical protein